MIANFLTDIMFALDSIPAIFGLTQETYLVITASAFALMDLRQVFFLLDGLLDRLIDLSLGLDPRVHRHQVSSCMPPTRPA
jgi:tellurite resistance protein TerC